MGSETEIIHSRSFAVPPGEANATIAAPINLPGSGNRSEWVDIAKGLAIGLMVLGHVGGGLLAGGVLSAKGVFPFFYQWIYTFHMATFMLLAGLFMERAAARGVTVFLVGRLGSLYYPSLLWGLITYLATSTFSAYVHNHPVASNLLLLLYSPFSGFWFLTTLLELSGIYILFRKLRVPNEVIALVALAVLIWGSYFKETLALHFGWWGLFLMLGVCTAPVLSSAYARAPRFALRVICLIGVVASMLFRHEGAGSSVQDVGSSVLGVAMLLSVAVLITRSAKCQAVSRLLALCGRYSLEIYLLHSLTWVPVRIILLRGFHVENAVVVLFLSWFGGVSVPVLAAVIADKFQVPWIFRLPVPRHLLEPALKTNRTSTLSRRRA
jgi:fucose 4-O-acetylase-like acetyltransferase